MFLIMSAAYIEQELQSEFGMIPPTFLPVGNKPLYIHQLEGLNAEEHVVLSLPQGFEIGNVDKSYLDNSGVELLWLPEGLTLGESIMYAINLIEIQSGEPLHLLHGDTLIKDLPTGSDVIGISEVEDAYDWAVYKPLENDIFQVERGYDNAREWVANGYFSFSSPKLLVRKLIEEKFSFIDAINSYNVQHKLDVSRVDSWLDFGHIHTYYRSKTAMTTQRAFNQMHISSSAVTKCSVKSEKMMAEANWFQRLPPKLKVFTPQLLSVFEPQKDQLGGYQIEYKHLTALNELFVFGRLPVFVWRRIINACLLFLDSCYAEKNNNAELAANIDDLLSKKTVIRLACWSKDKNIDLDRQWTFNGSKLPSINEIINRIEKYLPNGKSSSWYHGDLCFSNILYDFRTSNVKVIDPRGLTPDAILSPFGDITYDIAKLSHSIIGRYDSIIAGYFHLVWKPYFIDFSIESQGCTDKVESYFTDLMLQRYGFKEESLLAMQIHLFFSMLPLHSDNPKRQNALAANAFRLFVRLESIT